LNAAPRCKIRDRLEVIHVLLLGVGLDEVRVLVLVHLADINGVSRDVSNSWRLVFLVCGRRRNLGGPTSTLQA
jgi:hypothetical protein